MKKHILLLIILFLCSFFFCSCKEEKSSIDSISQLKEGSYVIGTPHITYCEEQAPREFPLAKAFRSFSDISAAYKALQQEKIDALIQDETSARIEISKGITNVKILNDKLDISTDIAVGISEKSKIVDKNMIDTILNDFINDGTLEDIRTRWIDQANYTMPNIELNEDSDITLKVATAGTVEPFSFYNYGDLVGYDIELSFLIAKALDAKIEFEVNPDFDSLIASTQSGKSDLLITNFYVTDERKTQIPLSIPYRPAHGCVIVKEKSSSSFNTLADLENKKVGYDSTSIQFESQIKKFIPSAEMVLYNNTPDSVIGLQTNRVDSIVTDLPNAKYLVAQSKGLKILPEYLDPDNYGFVFTKNSIYTKEFDEVITRFKKDNILNELDNKWFTDVTNPNKKVISQDPNKEYKKTLKVVTTALLAPMIFLDENNNVSGYEADLIYMIGNELDYKIEFIPPVNDMGSILASIDMGKCDIAVNCISITEERKQKFDFSIPYYEGAVVLVVRDTESTNENFFVRLSNSFKKTFVVEQRWKMILSGMLITLIISVASGVLGLLIGFGLCMARLGKHKVLNGTIKAIIKIIQGTPIVVFLMIMYYIVFSKIDINAIIVASIAFGINFGVYSSEIMKSGFDAADIGQIEAARTLGYSKSQTFFKITFPQAAKRFIPVLRGEFISMVKMTSIAGYISVAELTRVGDIIRSKTMEAFFPLIAIAVIYFGLSELLTFSLTLIDKKLDTKNKPFKLK